MTKVENFRAYTLYNRSIDLTGAIYKATHFGNLTDKEVKFIRKKAVIISVKIASAIAQVNMKVQFKKLNEAKATLLQLRSILLAFKYGKKVDNHSWQEIDSCLVDVMKLMNGYFGWIGSNKILS